MTGIFLSLLGGVSVPVPTDPYFNYNALLLPGNGTNGAQNNTFLDSSTNNFTITRNGNTTQGTFTPYGSNWSNNFGGSTNYYLTIPSGQTPLNLSTGDFTVECWVNLTDISQYALVLTVGASAWQLGYEPSRKLFVYNGGNIMTSSTAITVGTWNHFAWTRSGTTMYLYLNGVQVATASNSSSVDLNGAYIAAYAGGTSSYPFYGSISNLRIVKGTAVYTGAFTPPTSPLTAITNTSLLTCQSNRFIDNSSNAFAITVTGSPSVQRFSPFNPSAPYAAGTIGGSGYFDGSGDYLSVANNAALNLGSSDYTIECWFYAPSAPTANDGLFTKGNTTSVGSEAWTLEFTNTSGNIGFSVGAYNSMSAYLLSSSTAAVLNTWNHVAVVRNGTAHTMYLNGASVATATASYTVTSAGSLYLGTGWYAPSTRDFIGYISNARLVIGTAVYTGAFTSPTAPLTAIANTQLLCSFTNGGIIDNAMMNDLETVGNAQISTTQSKFGGASMYFDGTGDYLVGNANAPVLDSGSGQITIEGWFYLTANIANGAFGQVVGPIGQSGTSGLSFGFTGSSGTTRVGASYVSTGYGGTVAISLNTWTHVAWVLTTSTTLKTYINGTLADTFTLGGTQNVKGIFVGAGSGGASPITGYIDDLRITKGIARYTSNFTAPTAAFPLS